MVTKSMKNNKGFTLIEVMIVVAIIGIIAAIGYPSYTKYLHKAGRAEGSALLLEVMEKQEQHYRRERTYATALSALGYAGDAETERYKIVEPMEACDTDIRRCVVVTANPQGKQPADQKLTLSSSGEKSANWD